MSENKYSQLPFNSEDDAEQALWTALRDIPRDAPSADMRRDFYRQLDDAASIVDKGLERFPGSTALRDLHLSLRRARAHPTIRRFEKRIAGPVEAPGGLVEHPELELRLRDQGRLRAGDRAVDDGIRRVSGPRSS